ncbi:MAG: hypothetical protein K9H84_05655 [Bacteroidales bacterium]|nr:hypothetical protein [Bacteroidales bacterium]
MKYFVSIFLTLILMVNTAKAQQKDPDNEKDSGYSGSVVVKGKHRPNISDAMKIKKAPRLEKIEINKEPVEYDIKSIRLPVSFELNPIRPARMRGQPLDKLYNNHLRLAMGTSTMPYLEYFYNTTRSRDNAFGVHLKHHSASGKIKNRPFPGFSDNVADIHYKKIFRNHILKTKAGYERNVVHNYGVSKTVFDTINEIKKDDILNLYNRANASIKFKSDYPAYKSGKLHHTFDLDFYYFNTNENINEINAKLSGNVYGNLTFLDAAEEQYLGVKFGASYLNNGGSLIQSVHRGLSYVNPYLKNKFDNIDLNAGLNLFVETDSASSRIKFYPDVSIRMELIKNILVLKGGITGKTSIDHLYYLTEENPFIHHSIPQRYQHHRSVIFAGLNASISKAIDFNAHFKASNLQTESFFIRDTSEVLSNRFRIRYDSVRSFYIKAEINYQLKDKLNISLGGQYTDYSLTALKEAWNRPNIEGYLKARYDLQEKIILSGELFYIGERKALGIKDDQFSTVSLDPIIDANISAEYRYSKLLSAFISFRNLAGQQYEKWSGYPTYGFQFMAGLTYSM